MKYNQWMMNGDRLKVGFMETTGEVCGKKKGGGTGGRRRHTKTPWWTERIKEAIRRKIMPEGSGSMTELKIKKRNGKD
jgi:hypothetical protein